MLLILTLILFAFQADADHDGIDDALEQQLLVKFDQCKKIAVMPPGKLINIGERGAPLNGAVWNASSRWSLPYKMQPDFTESVISQLEDRDSVEVGGVNNALSPVKAIILGGDSTLDAAITGNRHGLKGAAIGVKHAGKGLFRAGRAVGRALGIKKRKMRSDPRLKRDFGMHDQPGRREESDPIFHSPF